jgi:Tol biopolymer transport system component
MSSTVVILASVAGIVLSACGGLNSSSDAAVASIDTAVTSRCDPVAPFGPWVSLGNDMQNGLTGAFGRPSSDELEFYFFAAVLGSDDYNLYVSQRSTRADAFGTPRPLTVLNSSDFESNPSISSDGLSLWFESNRARTGASSVYVSTRPNLMSEFGAPGLANGINTVNLTNSVQPFITADNSEVWFVSDRPGGLGLYDIWQSQMSPSSAQVIASLNSTNDDWLPMLSPDKLTIYLNSKRAGGSNFDVFRARRSTVNDGFPTPVLVAELNVDGDCRIYGRHQGIASVATRQP